MHFIYQCYEFVILRGMLWCPVMEVLINLCFREFRRYSLLLPLVLLPSFVSPPFFNNHTRRKNFIAYVLTFSSTNWRTKG